MKRIKKGHNWTCTIVMKDTIMYIEITSNSITYTIEIISFIHWRRFFQKASLLSTQASEKTITHDVWLAIQKLPTKINCQKEEEYKFIKLLVDHREDIYDLTFKSGLYLLLDPQ